MCLFESEILPCKRTRTVGINAINGFNLNFKKVWLVAIATIFSKFIRPNLFALYECKSTQSILFFFAEFTLVPFNLLSHLNKIEKPPKYKVVQTSQETLPFADWLFSILSFACLSTKLVFKLNISSKIYNNYYYNLPSRKCK